MTTWIYSHNEHSEGANALKEALGIRKIRHENSRFRGGPNKRVINWGASNVSDEVSRCNIVNPPDRVRVASNKLNFFRAVQPELLPPWTTSFDEAIRWVGEGHDVCARTILNGHSAAGLVLMKRDNPDTFTQAPLYTQYVKKTEEYRIHVAFGQVIDFQRKTLSKEKAESGDPINYQIRNLNNGFIYQRGGVNPNDAIRNMAIEAVGQCHLDFGAVDIIWNNQRQRPYVLEINTAPGLTGQTVQSYADALREI